MIRDLIAVVMPEPVYDGTATFPAKQMPRGSDGLQEDLDSDSFALVGDPQERHVLISSPVAFSG